MTVPSSDAVFDELKAKLREDPGGILETLAAEHGVSTRQVTDCLPADHIRVTGGDRFEAVIRDVTRWGDVTTIVHTKDVVMEWKGSIPDGSIGHGSYNLHGKTGLGGHLRYRNCGAIYFLTRPFMNMKTASIQFFNQEGEPMFKIYVGRDESRALKTDQLEMFEALAARVCTPPAN